MVAFKEIQNFAKGIDMFEGKCNSSAEARLKLRCLLNLLMENLRRQLDLRAWTSRKRSKLKTKNLRGVCTCECGVYIYIYTQL